MPNVSSPILSAFTQTMLIPFLPAQFKNGSVSFNGFFLMQMSVLMPRRRTNAALRAAGIDPL